MHILNQIVKFNQSVSIIRHLGYYQTNEPVSTKLIFAEVACEVAFRYIYTLFNAAQRDMECFNLQLQMHNV